MSTVYFRNPYRHLAHRNMWNAMQENEPVERKVVFPMDVRVADDNYYFEAFLPGVVAEDLDVQIENNVVTIKGEIKIERNEDDRYLMKERPAGVFQRSIELPDDVDADHVDAELKNGVLTLRLPKSELSKPRKITISNN